jgi:hypothetical protein
MIMMYKIIHTPTVSVPVYSTGLQAVRSSNYVGTGTVQVSKLVYKMAKLKLYFSVIRPIVTYACETWILKETITHGPIMFERKIFGPNFENSSWRIKTNQKLDKIKKIKNIINFTTAQRLGWFGHTERIPEV